MMFPRNQYKDTVTLFTPYADKNTRLMRFYRRVLVNTFWNADSLTINRAGGTAAPEQITLNIPIKFNTGYVNRDIWRLTPVSGLDNLWSILIGGDGINRSVIIRGDVSYPALEQWRDRDDLERVFMQFRSEYNSLLHYPTNVDEVLYGPPSMHRITAAC